MKQTRTPARIKDNVDIECCSECAISLRTKFGVIQIFSHANIIIIC